MARLPYVDPDTAPEAVRATLRQLPAPLKIFRLMALAEENFRDLVRLGTSILGRQSLPARLRELAILRVARLSGAEYEWVQHVPIARAVGVGEAAVEALAADRADDAVFGADERAVLRFTTDLVRSAKPSDAAFAEAHAVLGDRQLVELVVAIGYYMLIARLMETAQIDLDPPASDWLLQAVRPRRPES